MCALSSSKRESFHINKLEKVVYKVLFIKQISDISDSQTYNMFSGSMLLSGLRCILSYVVLPFLAPILKLTTTIEPFIGIPIGVIAIIFDYIGIRRFWLSNHRLKWIVSIIYLAVMCLVAILVAQDIRLVI